MPSQSYRASREAKQLRASREAKQLRALQAAAAAAGTGGNTMSRYAAAAGSNGSAAVPLSVRDDDSPVEYRPETPSDFTTDDDEDEKAVPTTVASRAALSKAPAAKYMHDLAMPSRTITNRVKPKSKLLVSDLDNTLFGPSGDGVVARPYLRTFLRYIMHPESPYALAIWTFSGRMWGLAHLRQVGMGSLLFDSDDKLNPKLKPGLLAFWGFEDSGFLPNDTMPGGTVKDLSLLWEMLNIANGSDWSPFDSLIVDDQRTNARAQPDSLVNCPVFTKRSYDDEFLLAFIGVLDALSQETNIADAIRRLGLYQGIPPVDLAHYAAKGKAVCDSMDIKVSRGTPYPDPTILSSLGKPSGMRALTPVHDAANEAAAAIVSSLGQNTATPSLPVPKRVAAGMPLAPTRSYLAQVDIPSRAIAPDGRPRLVVFDLDGTLYHRPPQHLEHFAAGEPAGRPYLRSMLTWLFRPESPWTVAIWTGSQKQTAVECLCELDLGLVGPKLVGTTRDQAELLHPKLVALWAREDFGLTRKDFYSYVAVVKDLARLWRHLNDDLHLGPFGVENTVMVDDTPEKLRAQPFSLVAAPTFDYPLGPSLPTYKAQLDAFLLALVAVLYHLECESNIANYLRAGKWNIVKSPAKLQVCRAKGVQLLQSAGILIAAEGRGPLPNAVAPGRSSDITRVGNASGAPLTASRLAALTGSASHAGVTSDTDNSDTTEDSINSESPDSEEEANQPAANGTESRTRIGTGEQKRAQGVVELTFSWLSGAKTRSKPRPVTAILDSAKATRLILVDTLEEQRSMQGRGAVLSVSPNAQAGPSRPITFRLPPSPRLTEFILPPSSASTPPVTPPAFDRPNPFAASPSGSSFLGRLSRKLSVGKSSLTRRDSSRSKTSEANMPRNVTFAVATSTTSRTESPTPTSALAPASGSHGSPMVPPFGERKGSGALRLRRSLRVSGVKGLRRARSEGNAAGPPRRIVAVAGENASAQLSRSATGGKLPARTGQAGLREHPQKEVTDLTEVHSHLGSYYWSDTLGVCWDGRERVTPDPLFAKEQQYTSDADFIPTAMQQQATRVVYASTLSSFPPRPPLKPRAPELSPAAQIIADYRAQYGTLTPSVRSFRLDAPESAAQASSDAASTLEPPTPRRLHLDTEALPQQDCTESPASSRSSASQAARKRFAHADPAEQLSPTDTLAAGSESDTSAEDEAVAPTSSGLVERDLAVPAPKQA